MSCDRGRMSDKSGVDVAAKDLKKKTQLMTMKELREQVTSWSSDTIKRRIKDSNFPAMLSPGGEYIFDFDDVVNWFHSFNVDPARRLRRK